MPNLDIHLQRNYWIHLILLSWSVVIVPDLISFELIGDSLLLVHDQFIRYIYCLPLFDAYWFMNLLNFVEKLTFFFVSYLAMLHLSSTGRNDRISSKISSGRE